MIKSSKKFLIYSFYFIISLIFIIFISKFIKIKFLVNDTNNITLTELDSMNIIKVNNLNTIIDNDYIYEDYNSLQKKLDISLLNSELSLNNPYMLGKITTNKKDFLIISYENYILGDTSNYNLNNLGFYSFDKGIEYYSPISIEISIILSENQTESGLNKDYLGFFNFIETYTSQQGYKINIFETILENNTEIENYISEKIAVFVVDGIRYELKGRTSIDNIKYIIDNMKYTLY